MRARTRQVAADLALDGCRSETDRARLTRAGFEAARRADTPRERRRAHQVVVLANVRLAHGLARCYQGRGIPLEDLEQVACLALVKSVRRFDPEHGTDFLGFAVPTIRGELRRCFRESVWVVRPPRRLQEIRRTAIRSREDLEGELGREPTLAELAVRVAATEREVSEALQLDRCFSPVSLDQPLGEGGAVGGDLMAVRPDDDQSAAEARVMLRPAVRRLTAPDQRLLELRYLDDLTQAEIGRQLGFTQTQVSRLLDRVHRDLRERIVGPLCAGP